MNVSTPKNATMEEIAASLDQAKFLAVDKIDSATFPARCVLQFVHGVLRELAGVNVELVLQPNEINGLFLVMDGAIKELEVAFTPEGKQEVAA